MMCGKLCSTEKQAKAFCLVSKECRSAYYCQHCQAWHTTTSSFRRGDTTQLRPLKSCFN